MRDTVWMNGGACQGEDPDLFSPTTTTPQALVDQALAICGRCEVIDACNAWADEQNIEHGIWGGRFREPAAASAIRECAGAGMKDAQIAKKLGYRSKATVASLRRQYGIPPAVRYDKPWTGEELELLEALLAQDWSYAQVGAVVGRSHTAVRKAALARGWESVQTRANRERKELIEA